MVIMVGCGGNSKQDPLPPPPPPLPGSSYSFTNASTPLDITESDKDYSLSVQLVDGAFGLPGETVKMVAFDSSYGIVDPAEVETDDSGWAHFSYHSPDNVSEIVGQSKTLQAVYDDENGTVLIQDFVLNFYAAQGGKYHLSYSTTQVLVELALEGGVDGILVPVQTSYEISTYVVGENDLGIEGEKVRISILDADFGYITPGTAVTDDTGRAVFTYTVSDNIASMYERNTQVNLKYPGTNDTNSTVTIEVTYAKGNGN